MKKLSFWNLLLRWCCLTVILTAVNGLTLRSTLLQDFIQASLGIYLLIWPTWPEKLGWWWPEEKCRRFIRIVSLAEVAFSFVTKLNF